MRATAFPSAVVLALALTACGSQTKIEECNALVSVNHKGVDKVKKGTTATPDGGAAVDELRALADELDNVAKQTAEVKLTLPDLQKYGEDYKAMATEVAASARELADAVDNVDMEKMTAAQARMDAAVKREDPLVGEINKFCQTP
ncbi:MAG: hypothetical protein RIF41_16255 [Polyangiaceae bacterium]